MLRLSCSAWRVSLREPTISYDNTGEAKRKKSAELLLLKDVPVQMLRWFVTYNEDAKKELIEFGIEPDKIYINPAFYF